MRTCVTATGGLVVLADSFKQSVFKESFKRMFKRHDASAPASDAGHLAMGFNGTMEVLTSREYKVYAVTPQQQRSRPTKLRAKLRAHPQFVCTRVDRWLARLAPSSR